MPIADDDGVVIAGFSASGASIGPFVDIGVDRRLLIAQGKPANAEDLIVLWALGLDYEGQHGDDAARWVEAFGELAHDEGLGYHDPPPAHQPEHTWAVALADRAMAEANERGLSVAVAVVDRRGDPIQQDCMDGAATAGPFVAEAVAAGAATFQRPSGAVDERAANLLPYRVSSLPGGLPIAGDGRVVAGLGVAGPDPDACHAIAAAVL
jgi:uncharacterized protein GlcG (DUF336 family)